MAEQNQGQSKAPASLMANPLYWLSVGPTMVLSILAFIVSWPLGPGFIDEGGITKVRLAIALIAFALFLGVMFIVNLLFLIITRLDHLPRRLSDARVQQHQQT